MKEMEVNMNTMLAAGLLLLFAMPGEPYRIPPHEEVARMARFVANQCNWASMATISTHEPVQGQPFSNAFSISDGPVGSGTGVPYMFLTSMEISVQDLKINGTEATFAKKALFSRHPEMVDWPTDHNWFFAKMNITKVWVLDYFGGVKTVTPEDYFKATPFKVTPYNRHH
ncbi:unnamed protein product [Coregonus sp. 'balchen']|nr:unnamed protein product [Coregonus sp. 'balchen']